MGIVFFFQDASFVPSTPLGMVPVPNPEFIYNYVLHNPNVTAWGKCKFLETILAFLIDPLGISFSTQTNPVQNIQYQIWYNASLRANGSDVVGRQVVSLLRGMDEAISESFFVIYLFVFQTGYLVSVLNDPTIQVLADIDITLKDWPVLPPPRLADTVVVNLGPVFFFCSQAIIFISSLTTIVAEKEAKLRHALEMMGLYVGGLLPVHACSILCDT